MEFPFTNQLLYIKKNVMNVLMRNANAEPFKVPVNPEILQIPQYPRIIKCSMDFGTIKSKLEKRKYQNSSECQSDFLDVFRNCYIFNEPGCIFVDMALKLENLYNRKMAELPEPEVYASEQAVSSKSSKSNKSKKSKRSNSTSKIPKSVPAQTPLSVTVPPSTYTSTPSLTNNKRQRVPSYLDESQTDEPIIKKSKINTQPSIDMKSCKHIILTLMSKKYNDLNRYFLQPVDVEGLKLHDYFDIVKKPMDLSTVRSKLFDNVYQTNVEFADDIRLIFHNCYLYNPENHEVYRCGKTLDNVFNKLYQNCFTNEGASSSRNVISNNNPSNLKQNKPGNLINVEDFEPLLHRIINRQTEIDSLHRDTIRSYEEIQRAMTAINRSQLINCCRRSDQTNQNPVSSNNRNESNSFTNRSSNSSLVSSHKINSHRKSPPNNNTNHVSSSLSSSKPDNQSLSDENDDEDDDMNSVTEDVVCKDALTEDKNEILSDQKIECKSVKKNEAGQNEFSQEPSVPNSYDGDDKSSINSCVLKDTEVKLTSKNVDGFMEDSSRDSEKISNTNKSTPNHSLNSVTNNNNNDEKKSPILSPIPKISTDDSSFMSQQPTTESICLSDTIIKPENALVTEPQLTPPTQQKMYQSPKHSDAFIEEISAAMNKLNSETNMKLREFINKSEKKTIISLNIRALKMSTIKGVYKLLLKSKEYSNMVEADLKNFSKDERIQLSNELRQVTESQSHKIIKILRETEDVDSANEDECEIDFQTMKLITLHRLKAFSDRCIQKNKSKSTMESNDDEDSDSDSSDSSGSNALSGSNQNSGSNSDASSTSSSDNDLCEEVSEVKSSQSANLPVPFSNTVTTNTNTAPPPSVSSSGVSHSSSLPAQNPTISSTDHVPINSAGSRISQTTTTSNQIPHPPTNKKPSNLSLTSQKPLVQSQRLSDSESDSNDEDSDKSNSQQQMSMSQQSSHLYKRPKYTNLWKNKSALSSSNNTPNNNASSQQMSYKVPNSQHRNKVTTPNNGSNTSISNSATNASASHAPNKQDPNKLHESLKQIFQDAQAHEKVKKHEEELRQQRLKDEEKQKQKQIQTMHAYQENKKKQQHNEYQKKLHEQNKKEEKVKQDMKKRHMDIPALPEREDYHQILCDFEYYMNRDLLMRIAHSKPNQFHQG